MGRGDVLVRIGVVVFAVGVIAVVVGITPVLVGSSSEPPLALDLLMVAAPAGFGLALLGLLLSARSGRS
ncbi:MAG: hypothetical protein JWO22_307 [Frankiales bacterium]|nr:hypothetical protein [Frankiales bacterium]